jgi:hypothetical protein
MKVVEHVGRPARHFSSLEGKVTPTSERSIFSVSNSSKDAGGNRMVFRCACTDLKTSGTYRHVLPIDMICYQSPEPTAC